MNNKLVSNFKIKASHFDSFLLSIITHYITTIPGNQTYITQIMFSSLQFDNNKRSFDAFKGHANIVTRMLKICDLTITKSPPPPPTPSSLEIVKN